MTSGRAFRPTLGARTCAAVPAHLPFVMPTPPRGASTLTARPCVEIRAHATDQHHLAHILRVDHAGVVEDEQRRRLRLVRVASQASSGPQAGRLGPSHTMLSSTGEGTPFSDRPRGSMRLRSLRFTAPLGKMTCRASHTLPNAVSSHDRSYSVPRPPTLRPAVQVSEDTRRSRKGFDAWRSTPPTPARSWASA